MCSSLLLGSTLEIYGDVLDDFAFSSYNMEKYLQNTVRGATVPFYIATPYVSEIGAVIESNTGDIMFSGIAIFSPAVTLTLNGFTPVGGEYFTLDKSALLLASVQTNAMWIIPALAVAASIGVFIFRRRN